MWSPFVAFALLILILFIVARANSHVEIAQQGGIRSRYNKIFSYLYNLHHCQLGIETKSYVTFNYDDGRSKRSFTLNYNFDTLTIKCKIVYYDDTKFANGKVLEWHIMDNDRMSLSHEQYQLELSMLKSKYFDHYF